MKFDEFQHLARLYVVGALDDDELAHFEESLEFYGEIAEEFLHDCHRLETAMALSLPPAAPKLEAKAQLLTALQGRP